MEVFLRNPFSQRNFKTIFSTCIHTLITTIYLKVLLPGDLGANHFFSKSTVKTVKNIGFSWTKPSHAVSKMFAQPDSHYTRCTVASVILTTPKYSRRTLTDMCIESKVMRAVSYRSVRHRRLLFFILSFFFYEKHNDYLGNYKNIQLKILRR